MSNFPNNLRDDCGLKDNGGVEVMVDASLELGSPISSSVTW